MNTIVDLKEEISAKNRKTGIFLIVASLSLFCASILVKRKGSLVFYDPYSYFLSAKEITNDIPDVFPHLLSYFWQLLSIYFRSYFLPAYFLLLPAIILMAIGWKKIKGEKWNLSAILEDQAKERRFLVFIFCISFVISLLIYHFVFLQYPLFLDEYSYLFQADVLSSGKLYAISPPMPDFFQSAHIINDGKWYSKFTIGWPFLLTIGRILNLPIIIPALLSAGSLPLLYFICRNLFPGETGKIAGVLSVLMALLSPYFLLNSATFFPHAPFGFFALLYMYSLIKLKNEGRNGHAIFAGLAIMFCLLIRPSDGVVLFLASVPYIIFVAYKLRLNQKIFLRMSPILLGAGLGIGLLLLINFILNGNPFLFGFLKYSPLERVGFGWMGHTPMKGAWNFIYSSMRMAFYTFPFATIGLILILLRKNLEIYLLMIPSISLPIFYFFFYSVGNQEFGARYYYSSFILLLPIAAVGIAYLAEFFQERRWTTLSIFSSSFILMTGIFLLISVYPILLPYIESKYVPFKNTMLWLKNPPGVTGKSLIFIRDCPDLAVHKYIRNKWDYNNEKNLLAIFLRPEENEELITKFKDRKPYLVYFDKENNQFRVEPYETDKMNSPLSYAYAGINYRLSVLDEKKAEESFLTALSLSQGDPSYQFSLGYFYFDTGQYSKGARIFKELILRHPEIGEAQYYLGRCLGESGNKEEAKRVLTDFISRFPTSPLKDRAKKWIVNYR